MAWRNDVSGDAVSLIDALIKRKEDLDKIKAYFSIVTIFTYALSLLLLLFVYINVNKIGNNINLLELTGQITSNKPFLLVFVVSLCAHTYLRYVRGRVEAAKKKFEALRLETIDWLRTTWWRSMSSVIKDEISLEMDVVGINLINKS